MRNTQALTILGRWTAALGLCLLAACGSSRSAAPGEAETAVSPASPLDLPFPARRSALGLTESVILGKDAELLAPNVPPLGDALWLGALSGKPKYAAYRFNLGGAVPDSVIVELDSSQTDAAYLGLANYASGRWEFSGPFQTAETLGLSGVNMSPGGDIWVAVLVPIGSSAVVERLRLRLYAVENALPVASFTAAPLSGPAPLSVDFDATASSDADGSITEYAWDFDSDGVFDHVSSQPAASHAFTVAGEFTVRLRVTDDRFGRGSSQQLVKATPVDTYGPVATFSFAPIGGPAPLQVSFDASATTDSDSPQLLYEWDWDADGDYDAYGQSPLNSAVFSAPGRYNVRLRVTDEAGHWSVAEAGWNVVVSPCWQPDPPPAAEDVSGLNFALARINGLPALVYVTGNHFSYWRALDAAAASWAARVEIPVSGQTSIALAEIAGKPALAYVTSQAPFEARYLAALDADGTNWGVPVAVAACAGHSALELKEVGGKPGLLFIGSNQLSYCSAADAAGSSWNPPAELGTYAAFRLAEVDGQPALVCSDWFAALCYRRALDADGLSWPAPSVLQSGSYYYFDFAVVGGRPAITFSSSGQLHYQSAVDSAGSAWNAAQAVSGLPHFPSLPQSLAEVAGRPAIVYLFSAGGGQPGPHAIVWADDPWAASWSQSEVVGVGNRPMLFDAAGGPSVLMHTWESGLQVWRKS